MNKCPTCGKNCEGEACFQHKKRKPIPGKSLKMYSGKGFVDTFDDLTGKFAKQTAFFLKIWCKRPHKCENCDKYLGKEPLSYMFDHLLEKSRYPKLAYEEENICILCLECHDNKTRGFLTDFLKNKIKIVREKFGI